MPECTPTSLRSCSRRRIATGTAPTPVCSTAPSRYARAGGQSPARFRRSWRAGPVRHARHARRRRCARCGHKSPTVNEQLLVDLGDDHACLAPPPPDVVADQPEAVVAIASGRAECTNATSQPMIPASIDGPTCYVAGYDAQRRASASERSARNRADAGDGEAVGRLRPNSPKLVARRPKPSISALRNQRLDQGRGLHRRPGRSRCGRRRRKREQLESRRVGVDRHRCRLLSSSRPEQGADDRASRPCGRWCRSWIGREEIDDLLRRRDSSGVGVKASLIMLTCAGGWPACRDNHRGGLPGRLRNPSRSWNHLDGLDRGNAGRRRAEAGKGCAPAAGEGVAAIGIAVGARPDRIGEILRTQLRATTRGAPV